MRHRHDLQIGETGEIDLSHENRDHIAHDKAEQHGKLLGGALHEQLERKASHQRNQAKRQILPAAEIASRRNRRRSSWRRRTGAKNQSR